MTTRLVDARPEAPAPAPSARAPVEAVAGARRHGLRSVAVSVVMAMAVTLALGADGLTEWTDGLPVGALADRAGTAARAWRDTMAAVGLTRFGEAAEALLVSLRGAR